MKKIFLLSFFCCFGWQLAYSQIPDGSIAPDFVGTDIDGNTHHLYDLLDAGKHVFIDVSATWCGPCWGYHNSHAFRDLWETYGPPGTDEAFAFYIEGDNATNTACLYGPSGCVGGTQGDWVTGTPYPIIDDASIAGSYQIAYFPTIFYVCPFDKKVYEAGQLSMSGLWSFKNSHCSLPPLSYSVNSTTNARCYSTSTGAIDITPDGGTGAYTYSWSNGATTQDVANLPAGTYTVTIYSGTQSFVSDPIDIFQPNAPLSAEVVDVQLVGCNGVPGSITVSGVGGWESEYNYNWSNGQFGETAQGLSAGTYRCSVTDAEGCTSSVTYVLAPAVYPIAQVANPPSITCSNLSIQLNGTGSDTGPDFVYQWFASNGGNIVSGGTTLFPTVDNAGNYTLQVTNIVSTCATFRTVTVNADITYPTANAGPDGTVSCPQPLVTLSGSGSTGNNFAYAWTGPNVVSNGNTLSPTVGAPGVYTLVVTNTSNGCTKTSTANVTGNNLPPSVNTTGGSLTCSNNTVTINTATNSNHATFAWTGPNGYQSNVQNPSVNNSGAYQVIVSDTMTGCTNTATAQVISDTNPPTASTTAGSITCVVTEALVTATTPDTNATYAWTGPNGFTSNLSSFTVQTAGDYNLVLTDPDNGCSATSTATVASNTTPPTASAQTPSNLNCNTAQVQLNGTGSSQGSNFTYNWVTADGHIVEGENTQTPLVDAAGTYQILVSNTETGCTNTASVQVVQNQPVVASLSSQSNVSCFGGSNGAATALGAGGNNNFTYAWSNGGTGATITNLTAGIYIVSVTDGENCTSTTSATISEPELLAANATATGQTANGINDGTATANPSGGTAPFTYLWNNDATTQTITGLAPGNYSVVVTDANGCTTQQSVTVNSYNCALSGSIVGTDVTCFGANNGTATVSFVGGTEPFTYAWSNGETTASISGLNAGIYTVNVNDANNCPAVLSIQITTPNELLANAVSTNETGIGSNDGTATAVPTGGNGSYTYLWSNGETTQSISGLAPGSYTVQVTDGNNCIVSQTVIVNSYSCAISTDAVVSNVSCPSGTNGSVTMAITGGEAPFTYNWSNGGTTATISNLAAGVYTVSVTDANECLVVSTATVSEPIPFSAWEVTVNNTVCPNDPSGSASASISGGTEPYTFLWSNGATGNSISNVVPGVYSVQLTDANGCTQQTNATIVATDQEAPTASAEDATVTLDPSGNVSVSLAQVNAQFADNCTVASTVLSPNTFSCLNLGNNSVTLTVTDNSGLSTTVTINVKVLDNQAPTVTCPNDIVACSYNNVVTFQPATAEDNCLILNGQWNQTSGLPSGSTFPEGTTVQTFTFTDAGGNIGTCSFNVKINTAVAYDTPVVSNDHNGLGVGSIDITVHGGTAPFTYNWTLNGAPFATTQDLTGLNAGAYVVVVTDANGCSYASQEIVVTNTVAAKEPSWLSGVSLLPNPTSDQTKVLFAQPLNSKLELSVVDAMGRVLKTMYFDQVQVVTLDCTDLPSGVYTLRFRANQEIGARKLSVVK